MEQRSAGAACVRGAGTVSEWKVRKLAWRSRDAAGSGTLGMR